MNKHSAKLQKARKEIDKFFLGDLQYCLELDYCDSSHCGEAGCDEDGICRCGTIENPVVKTVNAIEFLDRLEDVCDGDLDRYVLDRVFSHSAILNNTQNYDINVTGGYYGEEIEGVTLQPQCAKKMIALVRAALSCPDSRSKIFMALREEYGYLLPEIETKTKATVVGLEFDKITAGASYHQLRLNKSRLEYYKDLYDDHCRKDLISKIPVCVVVKSGAKYRLIDGYHRLESFKKRGVINHDGTPVKVKAVVLE